jgi:16S rRNA (uracil1498-N3)-methyltransferase
MRRYRLFCPELSEGPNELSVEESRHAVAALRMIPGQEVTLFDGKGNEATGVVSFPVDPDLGSTKRRPLTIDAQRPIARPFELSHRITLAVAMTKPQRQGYLIEKCTELGVGVFWPLVAEFSVAKPSTAAIQRWSRRAIEAAKQSGRAWVPPIAVPQSFDDVLLRMDEFETACLTDVKPGNQTLGHLLEHCGMPANILVLVGPEGGWSEDERTRADDANVNRVSLGPTVLRTETAAIAVCAAVAMFSTALDTATEP